MGQGNQLNRFAGRNGLDHKYACPASKGSPENVPTYGKVMIKGLVPALIWFTTGMSDSLGTALSLRPCTIVELLAQVPVPVRAHWRGYCRCGIGGPWPYPPFRLVKIRAQSHLRAVVTVFLLLSFGGGLNDKHIRSNPAVEERASTT
jgi:hypothetical protein